MMARGEDFVDRKGGDFATVVGIDATCPDLALSLLYRMNRNGQTFASARGSSS
jgi:hypothetical protein